MYIGITKAIQEKYKIKLEEGEIEKPEIFCWHAQKYVFHRRTGLLIMNNKTRYCVVLYDIKKKEMENLLLIFKNQLERNMRDHRIDEDKIEQFLNELIEIEFVKTSNRSIISQINDTMYHLESDLHFVGNVAQHDLDYINNRMNGIPMTALKKQGYDPFPDRAMIEEMNRMY